MTHRAETLVAAVLTRVTGLTITGSRVFRGRRYPLQGAELPGLLVYMGTDRKIADYSLTLIDSELTIFLEPRVKSATAQIDTELNRIREEFTIALMADYTQGLAFVLDSIEGDTSEPEFSVEGDQPMGAQRCEWKFHYRRLRTNPGA